MAHFLFEMQISLAAALLCFGITARASEWSYQGSTGPEYWGEFNEACEKGQRQSPINLDVSPESETAAFITLRNSSALQFQWPSASDMTLTLEHDTALQVNVPSNGTQFVTTFDQRPYKLVQMHLHTPSEHHVNDRFFVMEAHFVHKAESDPNELLVLGVLMNVEAKSESKDPELLRQIVNYAGHVNATTAVYLNGAQMQSLIPETKFSGGFWTYKGSLTTPPCTESVQWFVAQDQVKISVGTFNSIKDKMGFNARLTQERKQ
jgi:carbonic anhydrase